MLLCAVTFIGGRDGVFFLVTGWLGVEALEYRIQESQSYARAKAYIHKQPTRDSVYLRANPQYSIAKNLITKQK